MSTRSVLALLPAFVLTFLVPLLLYYSLSRIVINPDGRVYHDLVSGGEWGEVFLPGHLAYGPLVLGLWRLGQRFGSPTLQEVLLFVSHVCGATAVFLMGRIAVRWGLATYGRYLAALGLAFSFGFWIEAVDIETYAPALLGVVASVLQMTRYAERPTFGRLVVLAACNVLAALFHLALVALGSATLCLLAIRWKNNERMLLKAAGTCVVVIGLGLALPYLGVTIGVLHHRSPGRILGWVLSADHGTRPPFDALSLPRALYGFARTFVYLEFLYTGRLWLIAAKLAGFLVAALWATYCFTRVFPRINPLALTVLGSLVPTVLLLGVLGISWFPSEPERWVFVLPPIWLALGATLSLLSVRARALAGGVVALLFVVNLVDGILPLRADTAARDRVLALRRALPPGSLVLTPGHDWVDYYHFFTGTRVETLSLITLAIEHRGDDAAFFRDLDRRLDQALAAGRPVASIRILDPEETGRLTPWLELNTFGYPIERLRGHLARRRWEESRLDDPSRTRVHWLLGP